VGLGGMGLPPIMLDDSTRSLTLQRRERAHILVVQGGSSSLFHLPWAGAVVIGRAPGVDVRLASSASSRQHARITVSDGDIEIVDLESHNGTRVNGERITGPRVLTSGDVIAIGDTVLVLHSTRAVGPSAGRALVPFAALRQRLDEEVERAVGYERPLGVATLSFGVGGWDAARVRAALERQLRLIDVIGQVSDTQVVVLLPELQKEAVVASTERMVLALRAVVPSVKGGVASLPGDGCRGDALLGASRTAAVLAEPGAVKDAADCSRHFTFGDRAVWVADPAMLQVYELIARLAKSDLSVLVGGETGVGKENAAYAIHHWSARAERPIVTLNCAALPDTLVESELFGYEKGAFSGAAATKPGLLEQADGGTVFLDEVGELTLVAQAKLLRALESKRVTRLGSVKERAVDLRVVTATNRKLEEEVKAGRFRQDLLFRLNAATVLLPPLRERPREVALLSRTFLDAARERAGQAPLSISAAAMDLLTRYEWPGNVRELKNAMEFAAATVSDEVLEPGHLPSTLLGAADEALAGDDGQAPAPSGKTAERRFRPIADELRDLERRRMEEALEAAGGVQKRAAELIAMPLRTFAMKAKQHGLTGKRRGGDGA